MEKQKDERQIAREYLNLISRESSKQGDIKICPRNSDEHETVKLIIGKRLMESGFKIYTECEFKGKFSGRPDLFAVKGNLCYIYEVLDSETDKKFNEKIKTYPGKNEGVLILKVKVEGFKPSEFCI